MKIKLKLTPKTKIITLVISNILLLAITIVLAICLKLAKSAPSLFANPDGKKIIQEKFFKFLQDVFLPTIYSKQNLNKLANYLNQP